MVAGSPLLACALPFAARADYREDQSKVYQALLDSLSAGASPIARPGDALSVLDFEAAARDRLSPAHFAYLASGTDDDATVRANRVGFEQFQLRPRRLTGVTETDLKVDLFGQRWRSPVLLAPVGNDMAFHPQGILPATQAAEQRQCGQILSTGSNVALETVNKARSTPVWFQLYARRSWDWTRALVARAEAAGCPALVLTVDLAAGSNRETRHRISELDPGDCAACHARPRRVAEKYPTLAGLPGGGANDATFKLDWPLVDKIRDATTMRLLVKGIVTREDAALCLEHGVDGIIVSNHGGRAENSGRSTIESLPEVVQAVEGRVPVLVDSGFRRGTDIFKALALGADAVCIGRPYIWGLASFGQAGVEAVLALLDRELALVMRQCGTPSIADISREYVV